MIFQIFHITLRKRFSLTFIAIMLSVVLRAQVESKQPSVGVGGEVLKPVTLYADELLKMKRTEHHLRDFSGLTYNYGGVSLMEILKCAGAMTDAELSGEDLAKYVLIQSADGSEVVISLADLDPSLRDETIILADQMNGKPLPRGTGPFRLIIPSDKKRTRWIWEVTNLVVRYARE